MADPGISRGGGVNPKDGGAKLIFDQFSQNLHENKIIWTERGRVPGVPLGSANGIATLL